MEKVGFKSYFIAKRTDVTLDNKEVQKQVGNLKFYSWTVRAFKIPEIEDRCEDYGEFATYLGTMPDYPEQFKFDEDHTFVKGEKVRICRNFALIFTKSRFAPYFQVTEMKDHNGIFQATASESSKKKTGCC